MKSTFDIRPLRLSSRDESELNEALAIRKPARLGLDNQPTDRLAIRPEREPCQKARILVWLFITSGAAIRPPPKYRSEAGGEVFALPRDDMVDVRQLALVRFHLAQIVLSDESLKHL